MCEAVSKNDDKLNGNFYFKQLETKTYFPQMLSFLNL